MLTFFGPEVLIFKIGASADLLISIYHISFSPISIILFSNVHILLYEAVPFDKKLTNGDNMTQVFKFKKKGISLWKNQKKISC